MSESASLINTRAEMAIAPWQPITNKHHLAVLGKLIEELNEASQRAARCIIQGVQELDPDSGLTNAKMLARELSDVRACESLLDEFLTIHADFGRVSEKITGYHQWHKLIS